MAADMEGQPGAGRLEVVGSAASGEWVVVAEAVIFWVAIGARSIAALVFANASVIAHRPLFCQQCLNRCMYIG